MAAVDDGLIAVADAYTVTVELTVALFPVTLYDSLNVSVPAAVTVATADTVLFELLNVEAATVALPPVTDHAVDAVVNEELLSVAVTVTVFTVLKSMYTGVPVVERVCANVLPPAKPATAITKSKNFFMIILFRFKKYNFTDPSTGPGFWKEGG